MMGTKNVWGSNYTLIFNTTLVSFLLLPLNIFRWINLKKKKVAIAKALKSNFFLLSQEILILQMCPFVLG